MSNALAIASVTRALLDLLNDGLINNNVSATLGQSVAVTSLPPDRVLTQQQNNTDPTQLNLYLYQITFNPGWRQEDLATRDSRGNLIALPLLPLNLHYLVTSYGSTDLHSEILMGYAMQLLHENPVLTRNALRRTLTANAVPDDVLPTAFQALRASDLADQVELVKLSPEATSVDEMTKIWMALQTHYRTSACYQASVVLIESRRPRRTPLPVLTRGPVDQTTGRDRGVEVFPDLLPHVPTIAAVDPPAKQRAARLGELVTIEGHRLDAPQVFARLVESRTQQAMELPAVSTGSKVTVQLPIGPGLGGADPTLGTDTDNWRCALYNMSLRLVGGPTGEKVTNELPMVLAPRIVAISAATNAGLTTFTVQCEPKVRATQRVSLIVGNRELSAEPFTGPPIDTVQFAGRQFVTGAQEWVRLRVDGIDSLLVDRSQTPPKFSQSDRVVIP